MALSRGLTAVPQEILGGIEEDHGLSEVVLLGHLCGLRARVERNEMTM